MSEERYNFLMSKEGQNESLTQSEIDEGWHFCDEMDGLLANSKQPDGDCFCHLKTGGHVI